MDYKSVLEEQIRELQKVQDNMVKQSATTEVCLIARTISDLIATHGRILS